MSNTLFPSLVKQSSYQCSEKQELEPHEEHELHDETALEAPVSGTANASETERTLIFSISRLSKESSSMSKSNASSILFSIFISFLEPPLAVHERRQSLVKTQISTTCTNTIILQESNLPVHCSLTQLAFLLFAYRPHFDLEYILTHNLPVIKSGDQRKLNNTPARPHQSQRRDLMMYMNFRHTRVDAMQADPSELDRFTRNPNHKLQRPRIEMLKFCKAESMRLKFRRTIDGLQRHNKFTKT